MVGISGTFLNSDAVDAVTEPEPIQGGNQIKCFVTLHRNLKAMRRDEFVVGELNISDFLTFLRGQHRAVIDRKEEFDPIQPLHF